MLSKMPKPITELIAEYAIEPSWMVDQPVSILDQDCTLQ